MEDQDYILFEDYSSGALSETEATAFENQLNSDPEFKKAFNTYKELSHFLEHKLGNEEETTAFKNNLESVSNTYFEDKTETTATKKFNFYKYAIAASVALFLGFFVFNQFSNPTYSDYADYESISLTVRGNQDELKTKAEQAFNTKNFSEAEVYFAELLEKDALNNELQLYKSIALIEQNKFNEADMLLKKISQGNSAFKNKALWYLALSKLKQEEFDACMRILETITEEAEDYKQAQKLLKKLN